MTKKQIDWNNLLFDNRALFLLLLPIIIEQLLISLIGMFADWGIRSVIFILRFLSGKWIHADFLTKK